jgi:hypothetical protein
MADKDYLASRAAFRMALPEPFFVLAGQSVEKLLKGILLFRGHDTRSVGHDLERGLDRVRSVRDMETRIPEPVSTFVLNLNAFARNRYLEYGYSIHRRLLPLLDETVWRLRRYCWAFGYTGAGIDAEATAKALARIHDPVYERYPSRFRVRGGVLESVLDNPRHPARATLIWQNRHFGTRRRLRTTGPPYSLGRTAPHVRLPEVYPHIKDLVRLPEEYVRWVTEGASNYRLQRTSAGDQDGSRNPSR